MAEINLYERDLANIFTARMARPNIILVGDIDRGGVFASLYGTFSLLPEDIRKMICGFVINRLRGREDFLYGGIKKLEEITNLPVIAVIPYINSPLPSEDSCKLLPQPS